MSQTPQQAAAEPIAATTTATPIHGTTLDRRLTLALWLAGGLCATPLWLGDTLPLLDLPQHLATVRILRDLHAPQWGMQGLYEIDLTRTQYLGWYAAAVGLSQVVSIVTAAKLLLSAYVLALPWAMAALLRAFGLQPALAVCAAPLAWNSALWMGYLNYVSALPLVLWWLAAAQRAILAPVFHRAAALRLALWPVAVWLLHVQALLHGALLVGAALALAPDGWRRRRSAEVLFTALPAALCLSGWAAVSAVTSGGSDWRASRAGHNITDPFPRWTPLSQQLQALPRQQTGVLASDADLWLCGGMLLALAVLAAWRSRGRWEPSRTLGLVALGSLLLYFALPTRYRWVYSINTRTVPLTTLLAVAALARPTLPARPVVVVGLVAALLTVGVVGGPIRAFSDRSRGVRSLLREVPRGGRGLGILYRADSGLFRHIPYLHVAQYAVLERGGMADFSFANFPQSPVVFAPPGPPLLPERFEKNATAFDLERHGSYYDWFLVRLAGNDLPDKFASAVGKTLRLVRRRADWVLLTRNK